MKKCYICCEELTKDNDSVEHIIPNAIAGDSYEIAELCKEYNISLE